MGFVGKANIISIHAFACQETRVFEAADGLAHAEFGQSACIVHVCVPETE